MAGIDSFFKLLRGAQVIAPEPLGRQDILIAGDKIAALAPNLTAPAGYACETVDMTGRLLAPGFIDSHVHLIGGGGEGGFTTRTPEITLSKITAAAVTTVVGCLGTDGITRHVTSLLAKARALEEEGVTAYIYTGAYELPTPTITGSVRSDIILIDKIIGAGEIAMSDHRSAQPLASEYRKLAAQARIGGMLSGKAGVVDVHMGDGRNGLKMLFDIVDDGEIPPSQFIPTHINRNRRLFEESLEWAKIGGIMDVTSGIDGSEDPNGAIKPATAVKLALDAGVKLTQITMSSDGNGSMPVFDGQGNTIGVGVASQASLLQEVRDMVLKEGIPVSSAIQVVTANVARVLKLYPRKGCIAIGADADIVALDEQLNLTSVWAKGRHMVRDGQVIVRGTFE